MSSLDEVAIDDADRARIEYLSSGDFSQAEAERIVRFAKIDPSDRDPEMLGRPQTARDVAHDAAGSERGEPPTFGDGETCGDVRRRMRDADRPAEVCDVYSSTHPSTIFHHAEGRCTCDTDVPPTTSPRVSADECSDIRDAFRSGATKSDIEADFRRSTNAVNKHLFGRCDHDVSRDDQTSARLTSAECGHLRDVYARNARVDFDDLSAAFRVAKSTIHRHVRGGCEHTVDVDAVPGEFTGWSSCRGMRRKYKDRDVTVQVIADDFETSRPTADYHIFGRCACEHDEAPATRD